LQPSLRKQKTAPTKEVRRIAGTEELDPKASLNLPSPKKPGAVDHQHPFYDYFSTMDIIRSWREQKVLLKRIFPILTDKDFAFEEAQKEAMFTNLGIKLNKTRSELELIFADLQRL
jgi:hypothetical protein